MDKPKIYLDNCCYNRPFDNQSQIRISLEAQAKLYIQRLIVEKKITLVFSYMSWYENSTNPHIRNRKSINDFFRNADMYIDYDVSEIIEKRAIDIMKLGIKEKDALHLSCAIEAKCGYFITTDDRIIKNYQSNDILVYNPITFVENWEGKNA
jgi:predicted nucleic acid-binding protein